MRAGCLRLPRALPDPWTPVHAALPLLQDRIVADEAEFVVVSKPARVPAAPTVDNVLECAPTCAAQAIDHPQPLLVTHRLDQCTEGLLVLGKTKAFVQQFNELVQRSSDNGSSSGSDSGSESGSSGIGAGGDGDGEAAASRPLRKFYRAATLEPPPLGLQRHWLSIERRQQGLPAFTIAHEEAVEGSLPAALRVVEVQPIRWGRAGCARDTVGFP